MNEGGNGVIQARRVSVVNDNRHHHAASKPVCNCSCAAIKRSPRTTLFPARRYGLAHLDGFAASLVIAICRTLGVALSKAWSVLRRAQDGATILGLELGLLFIPHRRGRRGGFAVDCSRAGLHRGQGAGPATSSTWVFSQRRRGAGSAGTLAATCWRHPPVVRVGQLAPAHCT